jgi:hypothetical protein
MKVEEFKEKIKVLIKQIYKDRKVSDLEAVKYDELTKFPELKQIIVTLLTDQYDSFLGTIDWVAPRPTTFRMNLKNDQDFYLIYTRKSWICQVQGKKYYLQNLPEEERAVEAIARILRYGNKIGEEGEASEDNEGFEDTTTDVSVDVSEPAAAETPTEET